MKGITRIDMDTTELFAQDVKFTKVTAARANKSDSQQHEVDESELSDTFSLLPLFSQLTLVAGRSSTMVLGCVHQDAGIVGNGVLTILDSAWSFAMHGDPAGRRPHPIRPE